uniref:Transcriptional regulator n=1 Tax=Streptomyces sp. NBC_00049 TaxID=2903617 RepID=A0AAU2JYT9_9ACTN
MTLLRQLADGSRQRRHLLAAGVYSLAALPLPTWPIASRAVATVRADPAPGGRLEPAHAAAAEQMMDVFSAVDHAFGGGHSRTALSSYLAHDIGPRLRAPASPRLRERMLAAATQLAYLAGHMHFDDHAHGQAQHYYQAAMDLAAANNDRAGHAMSLRALSVQAGSLGHHSQALALAETAVTGRTHGPPLRQAFLYGQLAVAHAAIGDRQAALRALTVAERSLDRATSTTLPPIGGYHPAALAHQEAAVRALFGDRPGAVIALSASCATARPANADHA